MVAEETECCVVCCNAVSDGSVKEFLTPTEQRCSLK
jgi:hypothetical protein